MSAQRKRFVLEVIIREKDGSPAPWGLGQWHTFGRYATRERAEQALRCVSERSDFLNRHWNQEFRIVDLRPAASRARRRAHRNRARG